MKLRWQVEIDGAQSVLYHLPMGSGSTPDAALKSLRERVAEQTENIRELLRVIDALEEKA